jgi:glutamine synthetase
LPQILHKLKEAVGLFERSTFAREAFGDDVVDHYATFYRHEQAAYDESVTDWERR